MVWCVEAALELISGAAVPGRLTLVWTAHRSLFHRGQYSFMAAALELLRGWWIRLCPRV